MKRLIVIAIGSMMLVACGDVEASDEEVKASEQAEAKETKLAEKQEAKDKKAQVEQDKKDKKAAKKADEAEQKKKDDAAKEEKENGIKLDDELLFAEFKINMKSVKLYEEDGKSLAELKYTWTNQAGDGNKYFFALTGEDVFQGDQLLTETTGAAIMENKKTNSYHEHNGEGGTVNIRLVYELVDKDTPITLKFTPMNEFNEDKQEITIDIK